MREEIPASPGIWVTTDNTLETSEARFARFANPRQAPNSQLLTPDAQLQYTPSPRMGAQQIEHLRGSTMSQGDAATIESLTGIIRSIPDFPKPGILFRDITPLLANGSAFKSAVDAMAAPYHNIDHVVSIESRGFIFGSPIAYALGAGLVPVRKVGRLPGNTLQEEYELEYGVSTVEIHSDAIKAGQRVIIVDDLLATGGTIRAAVNLVERLDAELVGISVLIELKDLKGREKLAGQDVRSLIVY